MFCYNCGNRIDDNARFCLFCGADQRIDEQPAAPAAPAQPVVPVMPAQPVAPVMPAQPVVPPQPVVPAVPEIPDVPMGPVGQLEDIPPVETVGETEVLSPDMLAEITGQPAPQEDMLAQMIQATETPVVPVETVIPEPVFEPVAPAAPVIPEIPEIPDLGEAPTIVLSPMEPFAPVQPAQPVVPVEPVAPVMPAQPVVPVEPVAPVVPPQPVAPYAPAQPAAPAPQVPVSAVAVQEAPVYGAEPAWQQPVAEEQPQPKKKKKWPLVVGLLTPLLLVLAFAVAVAGHYFLYGYWPVIEDPAELAAEELVQVTMSGDFSGIRDLAPTEYWNARADIGQQIGSLGQQWQTGVLPDLLQQRFQVEGGMAPKSFQPSQKPTIRNNRDLTADEQTLVQTALSNLYQIPASRIQKMRCLEVDIAVSVKYENDLKQEMQQSEILFAIKLDDHWYLLDETGNFAVDYIVSQMSQYQLGQTQ